MCQGLSVLDIKKSVEKCIYVTAIDPPCVYGLTSMILLKVARLLPNPGGLWWEVTLVDLASLFIMFVRIVYGIGNILKVVFSSEWRKCQPFDSCIMMALLFLTPIYAECAMWIWSETMPSLYVVSYPFAYFCFWVYVYMPLELGRYDVLCSTFLSPMIIGIQWPSWCGRRKVWLGW